MTKQAILRRSESEANATSAKIMIIIFSIMTVGYILNVAGVFIIDNKLITGVYVADAIYLLLPVVIHKIGGPYNKALKYVYITSAGLFMLTITVALTYHAVVFYLFPIVLAGLYFNRRLTVYSIIVTVIVTAAGQILGYYLNLRPDYNFYSWYALFSFAILPRFLILLAMSSLLLLLTSRTSKLLADQIEDSEKILELHQDMVFGFAALVESRDEDTGGHIKRTSRYVELLAKELQNRGIYSDVINDVYIKNLAMAAPMHDIGKVAVPDAILQKPGRLTSEEFEIMKTHAAKGGQIIRETFGHVGDEAYRAMAYNVARHHHEKYNGLGYPDKLGGQNIPLSARIMSIADVFDAVSQKRCYRDAMPLQECFEIIESGRGTDFDPVLVDVFLDIKDKVIQEYSSV